MCQVYMLGTEATVQEMYLLQLFIFASASNTEGKIRFCLHTQTKQIITKQNKKQFVDR